jgi:hypothetical protein
MSSVMRSPSQTSGPRYFINVSSCHNAIFSLNATTGAATTLNSQGGWFSSLVAYNNVSTPGQVIVKDMGRSVFVSTQSTVYRKVQLVTPRGVGGAFGESGTANGTDFATGYIELGWFDGAAGGNGYGTQGGVAGPGSYSVWARTG